MTRCICEDVKYFFETYHPGTYRIYNCCPEMPYDIELFGGEKFVMKFDVQATVGTSKSVAND